MCDQSRYRVNMSPSPLKPKDVERLTWWATPDQRVETSDGRVIVEHYSQFSHYGKYHPYDLMVVRFEGDERFYGFLREVNDDDPWLESDVELRPVVQMMKPSWEWAEGSAE